MAELREIDEVLEEHSGLSRRVLEYSVTMKRLVDAAKQPGFSQESWAPLAAMVAVDDFERVGNFKEVMTWPEYVGFLTGWATAAEWEGSFRRITEAPGLVYLELEERSRYGDSTSVVNSVSVYEFNEEGQIVHLDIYLQMPLPDTSMLTSYEGIDITD
jgi:hypothetical protein